VNRVISFRVPFNETKFLNNFTKRILLLAANQFSNKVKVSFEVFCKRPSY